MPEGDTVYRTAHRLDQALRGAPLTTSDLRWPELSTIDLVGRQTLEVVPRGKNILQRVEGGVTIHSHLRMEGQWRVEHPESLGARQLANPQIRAVVSTASWAALGLRLGDLHVVPTGQEHTLVGHLGPDVLGPDWDPDEATRRLQASPTTVGAALLDQRNLAGVGTMYAAEALFLERLPPWSQARELDPQRVAALVERAHQLLDRGKEGAVQVTTGRGDRNEWHYAHARSGRPCLRCGTSIRVARIGDAPRERTMFYCPGCQGGVGPTDDGRPQRPLGSGVRKGGTSYRPRR